MLKIRRYFEYVGRFACALAIIVATASGVDAAVATWDANPEPDVAGYRLSYGTQSGVHTVVINVGKVTTYQFNPPPGKRYYVVVQAYNTRGELSQKSAEAIVDVPALTLPPPNQPPVLVRPANQTTTVNATVSLTLSASDPEGKALTFTAAGLPPGLLLNSAARLISGSPRTAGTYQVLLTVSDGVLKAGASFTWTIVASPNRPPVLAQPANQISAINASVSLALSASDPDGQVLRYTATGLPTGLSVASASGLISGRPVEAGIRLVTVTASDGVLSASRSFSWQVVANPAGQTASTDETNSAQMEAPPSEATENGDLASPRPLEDLVGVPGDYDGDGRPDLATYRQSSGEWRIWTSGSNFRAATLTVWGSAEDVPLPADYNGDRVTDLALYRPSTGTWHLWLSGTQTPLAVQWGGREDTPVALDYDADGKADLALIRNGGYDILLSSANYLKSVQVQ